MTKYAFAAAAALSALFASSAAMATKDQTATSTSFIVSVTVAKGCNVSNVGHVSFGTVAGTASAPTPIDKSPTITCTVGTEYDASLVSTNSFTMVKGTDSIAYSVVSGNTTLSAANAVVTNTGDGTAQTLPLRFSIPASAWSAANPLGAYSDTVTLSVAF